VNTTGTLNNIYARTMENDQNFFRPFMNTHGSRRNSLIA
jgi:hypothetical protein